MSLAVRVLWHSWTPALRDTGVPGDESGAPGGESGAPGGARLAGALGFAAGAALFLAAAGWAGARVAASMTHVPRLVGLTVGGFAVAAGAIAALVSLPATRALARFIAARDRRGAATPERVLAAARWGLAAAALAAWAAVVIRAASGAFGAGPYLATAGLGLLGGHALAASLGRRQARRAAARLAWVAVATGVAVAALAAAASTRSEALRDARQRARVGGLAIEALAPGQALEPGDEPGRD